MSHRICDPNNLGHGVVLTVFWGSETARGGKKFSIEISPKALILMGDWCGPKVQHRPIENRGA
jgi:hypothetical protein